MRCKVWIVLLFGFLSLWLSSCTSDDSSSSTASRMNDEFGECTEDRNGEIALDSTTGASYFCDNGKWTLDEDTGVFLDTLADGSYQCTDTADGSNYAKFAVGDSELAYSHHIGYSTSMFSSRSYSYTDRDTLYSRFVAGKDYDFALLCNSTTFMISDATAGSFIYKYYDVTEDSLIVMRCENRDYVTVQDSWTSPFNTAISYGSFTDSRDNRKYKTVTIDSITWMAQNLNYDTAGSYCYAGKFSNCSRYGRLYSWAMVMNGASASGLVPSGERGLCPDGWHVPSAAEWDALKSYADSRTDGMGAFSIRSIFNWSVYSSEYDSLNYTGTDLFGFSAVAGGYEDSLGFSELGETATWWTASEYNSTHAMNRGIFYDSKWMGTGHTSKADLRSLRCVENYDAEIPFNTSIKYGKLTDARDDQTYRTVTIGERTWMAENLNYEVESSSCYNDDIHYCDRYGRLYSWSVAMNFETAGVVQFSDREPSGIQGICPSGWHLPSIAEWKTLQANLSDTSSATVGRSLKAVNGWTDSTGGIAGTDLYGFRALPGGQKYANIYSNSYSNVGRCGLWWTTYEGGSVSFILEDTTSARRFTNSLNSSFAISVRCVKDYLSHLDSLLGQCRDAKRNTVVTRDGESYICDSFGWRTATSAEVLNFQIAQTTGVCTETLQDTIRIINSWAYTCDSLFWRLSTDQEVLNYNVSKNIGPCTATLEDSVRMRKSDSLYYICHSLSWRAATDAEINSVVITPALGECNAALVDSVRILPSSSVAYACDTIQRSTRLSWREATDAEVEAYSVRITFGTCTAAREAVLDTLASTGVVYICDSLSWRRATDIEVDASGRGTCTAAREGVAYTGRLGTAVCTSGRWFWGKNAGTITDSRDGNVYKTIQIGSQTWMAENLRFDPTDSTDWYPAFRYSACYNDSEDSCAVYGRLYGWITAMQGSTNESSAIPSGVQGLCPVGWHIPSGGEWNILYKYVEARSYDVWVAEGLESPETWVDTTGHGYVGVDDFGFSALAGGRREPPSIFGGVGLEAAWWTTMKSTNSDGEYFELIGGFSIGWGGTHGSLYFSVRCLKD